MMINNMTVMTFDEADFSIFVTHDGQFYTVTMTYAGETITQDGIKFVMDWDEFDTFEYADWVRYFNIMKEEWA